MKGDASAAMNCEEPAKTFKSLIEGAKDILATAPEALRDLFDKVAGGIDVLCQENTASFQVTSSASSTYDFEAKIESTAKRSPQRTSRTLCHDLRRNKFRYKNAVRGRISWVSESLTLLVSVRPLL